MKAAVCVSVLVCAHLLGVKGHGYMRSPPGRSSAWRDDQNYFHINYDDNANYCGGMSVQHEINGGKCGICGDDYRLLPPRYNERGGFYSSGNIVAQYVSGSTIEVNITITASHMGTFTFDLFQSNSSTEVEVESEFEAVPLSNGLSVYQLSSWAAGTYPVSLTLPDVVCSHCVLRWNYRTGNHAGPNSENFRSCADVMITRSGKEPVPEWVAKDPTATMNPLTQGPVTESPTSKTSQTSQHHSTRQTTTPTASSTQASEPTTTTTKVTTTPELTTKTTTTTQTSTTTTTTTTSTPTTTTTTTTTTPTTTIQSTTKEPTRSTATTTATTTAPKPPLAQFKCPAVCHAMCAQTNICPSVCKTCPEYANIAK